MKKTILSKTFHFLLILSLCWPLTAWPMEDTIIAVVNDSIITLKDLKQYLMAKELQLKSDGKSPDEIKKTLSEYANRGLNRLIEEKLFIDEADKLGIEVNEKILDERITNIEKKYPNEQIFLDALAQDGLTLSDLRNKLKDQMKTQSVIDYQVRSKISVSPQEITDYYQQNSQLFQKPEEADLESIFIAWDKDKDKTRKKVQNILGYLKEKEFNDVAKEYSEFPSVGLIKRGQLKSSIENIVFQLNVGDISSPVETEQGIYIFKLKEKKAKGMFSLEDVHEKTYQKLFQQKFRKRLKEWTDELKQKAYVEIKQ